MNDTICKVKKREKNIKWKPEQKKDKPYVLFYLSLSCSFNDPNKKF